MNVHVDFSKVIPSAQMKGEDQDETLELIAMHREASDYLLSFDWCTSVGESYCGLAIPGVVGLFLFKIYPASQEVDEWLWVVVGDIPRAHIVTDSAPNPACALDAYIGEMETWIEAVRAGKPVSDLIPVNVPATLENANDLDRRLRFLDENILCDYKHDLEQ